MPFFSDEVYAARRAALQQQVSGGGGYVVGAGAELAYLTGFHGSSHERLTALVVTKDALTLLAPLTDVETVSNEASLVGVDVVGWGDGEDVYGIVAKHLPPGPARLTASLTADHVFELQAKVGDAQLAAADFAVKDEGEISELARAGAAIDRVHGQVPELLLPDRTEAQVAEDLTELIAAEHHSVDFVIVGSGANGANPHHEFSQRTLRVGDPVVVDIGGTLSSGYHSDCTRTYVVGGAGAGEEFADAFRAVLDAQEAAVGAARPGMTAGELDAVARECLDAAGYGQRFTHRLGHGIGLAVHEQPFIIAGNDTVLREGMAFSIEPGVYLPGKFGVRIEDIVVLEAGGARRLNNVTRSLR
ncbi:M24 family metallopeptidase [Corynebacterium sp. Q4381]|uniref:M24 family metallopeptidase n=1 Tax=Corynebacterium sp. Marseille-Q4381 TaxID=3121597 RepID=UPI002FE5F32C